MDMGLRLGKWNIYPSFKIIRVATDWAPYTQQMSLRTMFSAAKDKESWKWWSGPPRVLIWTLARCLWSHEDPEGFDPADIHKRLVLQDVWNKLQAEFLQKTWQNRCCSDSRTKYEFDLELFCVLSLYINNWLKIKRSYISDSIPSCLKLLCM